MSAPGLSSPAPSSPAPSSSSGPLLVAEGIGKIYPGRKRGLARLALWRRAPGHVALADVSLSLEPGRLVTLLGPNGAGKSTLLRIAAGLVLPSSGRLWVGGVDVTAAPERARGRVGLVLADERSFFWRLSVEANLSFFAALEGLDGRAAAERIERLLALVGLLDRRARTFSELSTGQRQRLAIARGLLADPPIVLFDEATRSLDPGRAARIRRVIREILVERERRAVLFATHDLDEARALSDEVVLLEGGRVAARGAYDAVAPALVDAFQREADEEEREYARILARGGEASP